MGAFCNCYTFLGFDQGPTKVIVVSVLARAKTILKRMHIKYNSQ